MIDLTSFKQRMRGFTLIELLIVVAIIGILAGIGYPAYGNYMVSARNAEAKALLLDVMEKQEQWYRTNANNHPAGDNNENTFILDNRGTKQRGDNLAPWN